MIKALPRYLREMKGQSQRHLIDLLASLHRDFGITLTLLCACPEYRICHRSLLAELIGAAVKLEPRTSALL
jgi:uncharacterized protein YeaO (DUF488 family)